MGWKTKKATRRPPFEKEHDDSGWTISCWQGRGLEQALELQGQGPRVPVRRALPLPWARQRQQVYQQACRWPVRLEGSRLALSSLGPGLGQRWEQEQEQQELQELQRQEQEESLWHQRQESPAWQAPQLASPHLGFQA